MTQINSLTLEENDGIKMLVVKLTNDNRLRLSINTTDPIELANRLQSASTHIRNLVIDGK